MFSLCHSSRSFPISPAQAYRKKLQDPEYTPNINHNSNVNSNSNSNNNYNNNFTRSVRTSARSIVEAENSGNDGHLSNMIESNNEIQEPPVHIVRHHHHHHPRHRTTSTSTTTTTTTESPASFSRLTPNSLRVFGRYSIADEPSPVPAPQVNFHPNVSSSFNEIRIPVFLPSISYENPSNNHNNNNNNNHAPSIRPSLPPPPPLLPPPPPPYISNVDTFSPYFPSTPLIYPEAPTTPIPDPPGPINYDDDDDDNNENNTEENTRTTKPADFERKPKKKKLVVRLKVNNDLEHETLRRESDEKFIKDTELEKYKEYHKVMASPPFHTLSSTSSSSTTSSDDERVKALSSDHSMSCIINEVNFASKQQIEKTCRSHVDQIERLRNDCINQLKDFMEFNRARRQDRTTTNSDNNLNNNSNNSNEITGGKGFWWRSLFFSKASSH